MKKRAQITLFIIGGIVILVVFGLFFYSNNYISERGLERTREELLLKTPIEMQPIRLFVEECISSTAAKAIYLASLQGGYIEPPQNSVITDEGAIVFYRYDNENTTPPKKYIEGEISSFIESSLPICLDDFKAFAQQGKKITTGDVRVSTEVGREYVTVNAKFPVTLHEKDSSSTVDRFLIKLPIRLGYLYEAANEIVKNELENPDEVDLAYLSDFDAEISLLPYDSSTMVYSIYDEKSLYDEVYFGLIFATKTITNHAPKLNNIDDYRVKVNESLTFFVNATDKDDDKLRYYSNDILLVVDDESGKADFVSVIEGNYTPEVCVNDKFGAKDCKIANIRVKNG